MKRNLAGARVAIIGAGATGLTCAKFLMDVGFNPTILEKSRGLGGRVATRRWPSGLSFDHGAQYVTARSESFASTLDGLVESGHASSWRPRLPSNSEFSAKKWIVGVPAMNALVKPLAADIDVRLLTTVTTIESVGSGWRLTFEEDGDTEQFDIVVCTIPAPQASALLEVQPMMLKALRSVEIAPCWALMLSLQTPYQGRFDAWRSRTKTLAWIARDSSKPGRDMQNDTWVIHASPGWTNQHLNIHREQVGNMVVDEFRHLTGNGLPKVEHVSAHLWRYAQTIRPLGKPYLCSTDHTLFIGGDWCLGARVEYAFQSGLAISKAIISRYGQAVS